MIDDQRPYDLRQQHRDPNSKVLSPVCLSERQTICVQRPSKQAATRDRAPLFLRDLSTTTSKRPLPRSPDLFTFAVRLVLILLLTKPDTTCTPKIKMSGVPQRFWGSPVRYLRWAMHEKPAIFWSCVLGGMGPMCFVVVPPLRRWAGDEDPAQIPLTYPGESFSKHLCTTYWQVEEEEEGLRTHTLSV